MPNISSSQTRRAAVAGTFYPGEAHELAKMVADLLSEAGQVEGSAGAPPKALIAPHAGYIYSGPVAASAFATLRPLAASVRRGGLLGPAHFVPVRGLALPGCDAFATPLGEVALDSELAARVAELEQVEVSPSAHAPEHSLEVELPFLQTVLEEFRLLPLLVGDGAP